MQWIQIGLRIVPFIFGAVQAVERLITSAKGKDKQDAAVAMVGTLLTTIEGVTGEEYANNDAVQAATRKVIDAVVALQNVLASVAAKKVA